MRPKIGFQNYPLFKLIGEKFNPKSAYAFKNSKNDKFACMPFQAISK